MKLILLSPILLLFIFTTWGTQSVTVSPESNSVLVCSSTISSFPYSEGFESGIGAWTQDILDDLNWTQDGFGTPSSGTGPFAAIEGTQYLFIEASGSGTGYPSKVAILNSPCFDLSGQGTAEFNFKHSMRGGFMGDLDLEISLNGLTWTTIWNRSGEQGDGWYLGRVNLNAYAGSTIYLRFVGTTGSNTSSGWQSDMAIDDLSLTVVALQDTDGDGIHNTVDIDDDNDGILDSEECDYSGTTNIRIGYFPDSRRHGSDSDFGYTLDGSHFASYGTLKLGNTDNFGPSGVVSYTTQLVSINTNPVTLADLNALNLDIIHVGDFTYGSGVIGQPTTISNTELAAIYSWSTAQSTNLVIVSQREAELGWGYTLASGSTNPISPTVAGNATTIFDGNFGAVSSFNQGGSFQARLSGGDGVVLATETGGGAVIILDNPTGDIILSDVDILSNLGGVSFGDGVDVSNGNDIIFGNIWGYVIGLAADPDNDSDGALDCSDLDSDNDGIWDALEAGHGFPVDANGRIIGANIASGANGLYDLVETFPESGVLNYTYADSETVPDGLYDFYEIESDDDKCFDTKEAGVSDGDDDGIAGLGIPIVDANGMVTTITYTTPPNNNWQDPAINSSCGVCSPVYINRHIRRKVISN